jgi:hypothetical protein
MPWAKLDDNFHAHPKTYMVGLDGCGLFTKGLSYCAHYLTDGFLPEEWVYAQVPATTRNRDTTGVIGRLLDSGMFEKVDGGFQIHDYLACNPSRQQAQDHAADISAKRAAAGSKGGSKPRSKTEANDQANGVAKLKPVPVPVPTEKELSTVEVDGRAAVDASRSVGGLG